MTEALKKLAIKKPKSRKSAQRLRHLSTISQAALNRDKSSDRRKAASEKIDAVNALSLSQFKDAYFPTGSPFATFARPEHLSTVYDITLLASYTISPTDLAACFSLIETTSSADYKASRGGWHPDGKKLEMKDKDMKYLLVRAKPDREVRLPTPTSVHQDELGPDALVNLPVLAFLSFQLTLEPPYTVLYIYEIHLLPAVRRMGLGAHLMRLAQTIAQAVGVEKTMLTVFTSNQRAFEFYKSLGYGIDISSPTEIRLRGGKVFPPDYAILSKGVAPRV